MAEKAKLEEWDVRDIRRSSVYVLEGESTRMQYVDASFGLWLSVGEGGLGTGVAATARRRGCGGV